MRMATLVNPTTGEHERYGVIAAERVLGAYQLILTYDDPSQIWWIIVIEGDGSIHTIGYKIERREVCWEVFYRSTSDRQIAELFAS